ncbi:HAMP domain-containing sensor histidine kinase [Gordonibacter sp.]|uniref:sensor histidine kinase n=1 Tax=Gordonibacter sp. TaxID=1968902 RepID=UPI001F8ED75A|nr:HAMP domain-containing sensor histidine kinase [Gordonibacter sp.]HIW77371.1 HAMP domain-containing histidine kinase [Candidatus Gordonibacter avicola]
MRNLRFWQKTYLLTLAVALVALCGGLAFIGWQTQQQMLEAQVEKTRGEQAFVAQSLVRDLEVAHSGTGAALREAALARSYGDYYARDGAYLEVTRAGVVLFSNLPGEPEAQFSVQPGEDLQTWMRTSLGDTHVVIVKSALPDEFATYELSYARSLEPLRATWEQMRLTLVVGCAAVALVLAVGLFFVLRSLSRPLERLAHTADTFAAGERSVRSAEAGNDEIGTLSTSFNAMADAAEADINEISRIAEANARMAASLSHEIRTPLTAVRGYAEYLRLADATEDERDSALRYVVEESERLQSIAQRMLQLFSLEADEIERVPVDLSEVARRALRTAEAAARERGVEVCAVRLDAACVAGDEVLLESLVTNLLSNAVAACEASGIVQVSVIAEGSRVTLSVSDTGRGLAPEELERLGEPFYRPDKARSRAHGGAGLGVALCVRIAQAHGATLSFRSQEGEGTVAEAEFTVS